MIHPAALRSRVGQLKIKKWTFQGTASPSSTSSPPATFQVISWTWKAARAHSLSGLKLRRSSFSWTKLRRMHLKLKLLRHTRTRKVRTLFLKKIHRQRKRAIQIGHRQQSGKTGLENQTNSIALQNLEKSTGSHKNKYGFLICIQNSNVKKVQWDC